MAPSTQCLIYEPPHIFNRSPDNIPGKHKSGHKGPNFLDFTHTRAACGALSQMFSTMMNISLLLSSPGCVLWTYFTAGVCSEHVSYGLVVLDYPFDGIFITLYLDDHGIVFLLLFFEKNGCCNIYIIILVVIS